MNALNAHNLYRFYHTGDTETLALCGVSLHVAAGETVAVMGPSGSGKSTMLACLAGLDEPTGGYVDIAGQRLSRRPEAERAAIRAANIGVLLQSGNLFDHLTIEENVRLQQHLARKPDQQRLNMLLDLVGLAHRRHAMPAQVSGGEAARAGLAVALAADPPLVFADEPTGEVDAATEADLLALFAARRNAGGALLIVTHSDALARHADRVLYLRDGRISHA